MTLNLRNCLWLALLPVLSAPAFGAFVFEVDTDSTDDSVITYNSKFSFGGDTTSASQSGPSRAFGTTGSNSIFGGNGNLILDTYSYTYSPTTDADNLTIPAGTDLGLQPGTANPTDWNASGDLATGRTGGTQGTYNVYATWPVTTNVSGGLTQYTINTVGDAVVATVDQNVPGNPPGFGSTTDISHGWYLLGQIDYTAGAIVVTQSPTVSNSFVSHRAHGLLFELVPEPSSFALIVSGILAVLGLRRRR